MEYFQSIKSAMEGITTRNNIFDFLKTKNFHKFKHRIQSYATQEQYLAINRHRKNRIFLIFKKFIFLKREKSH